MPCVSRLVQRIHVVTTADRSSFSTNRFSTRRPGEGSLRDGVPVCGEQDYDKNPWGGILSNYGAVLAFCLSALMTYTLIAYNPQVSQPPITVIETPLFLKKAAPIFDEEERATLVAFVASNPEAGHVIPGTGGVRKLRWAGKGKGKRGRASHLLLSQ